MGMSGTFETNQMALYFSPGNRKYENATMILGEDSQPIAHSDGYEAYHKDICLMVVGCMSHVRRKFVEAQKASVGRKEIRKLSTREERIEYLDSHPGYKNILIAIHYINKLFKIEETLKKKVQHQPNAIRDVRKSRYLYSMSFLCIFMKQKANTCQKEKWDQQSVIHSIKKSI